ncbi:MAG: hypothetical protein AAF975_07510, partial [Spirochaetota bacterium]
MKKSLFGAMLALSASCIYGSGMWWAALASRAGWDNYALGFVSAGFGTLAASVVARREHRAKLSFGQILSRYW